MTAKQRTRTNPDDKLNPQIDTQHETQTESAPQLSDEDIRSYLLAHSDYFERHPDLLDELHISHSAGGAVSLVEKQVSVLRERNMEMRKRLNSLTANARENDRLYELTRELILSLLDAGNLDELSQGFLSALTERFEVEFASLILFGDPATASTHCRVESADSARIEIGALLKSGAPVCGTLREEELFYLFREQGKVGSAAVVPLIRGSELGVIAVGSEDPHRYTANTGTVFLGHLAEVIVRLLSRLDFPAA